MPKPTLVLRLRKELTVIVTKIAAATRRASLSCLAGVCILLQSQVTSAQGPAATQSDILTPPIVLPVPPPASPSEPRIEGTPDAPVVVLPAPSAVVVEPQKTAVLVQSVPATEPNARLDYNDGSFYLRSHADNLVLTFGGRVHIDFYDFAGKGVPQYHRANGTGLKPNLFFRRAILEFGGLIRKQFFFWFGGNFAVSQLDSNQGVVSPAGVYDGFAGYMPLPNLKFYFGQYNMPFSMENVTSSRWLDMMERSLTSRALAAPNNKSDGLSVWGETHDKSFEYTVGIFGGDGQNRPNVDDRFDGTIRLLARPFARSSLAIKRAHIGFDGRWGRRDSHFVRYDTPSLTTPGGYAFWSNSYGSGATGDTRIVPSRRQSAALAELYVPFERWDFKGEFLYLNEERREVLNADRGKALRGGVFKGVSAYGQLSFWLLGTPRISGNPAGYYGMTKLPDGTTGAEIPYALQLVLRGEVVRMSYDSNSRFGDAGGYGATKNVDVNAYQLGLNYWATKHLRLTAEYSLYQFSGTPYSQMSADNQAVAPGVRSGKAPDASLLHELSFRVGLAL